MTTRMILGAKRVGGPPRDLLLSYLMGRSSRPHAAGAAAVLSANRSLSSESSSSSANAPLLLTTGTSANTAFIEAQPPAAAVTKTDGTAATTDATPTPPTTEMPKSAIKPRASNRASFQKAFFDPETYHQAKSFSKSKSNPKANQISHRLSYPRPETRQQQIFAKQAQQHQQHQHQQQLYPQRPMAGIIRRGSNLNSRQNLSSHLKAQGETIVPTSTWVQVEGISPISSLEAMLTGIQKALDTEEARGMIDLDELWSADQPIPCLPPQPQPPPPTTTTHSVAQKEKSKATNNNINTMDGRNDKWVRKAKLILSPFGRPTGWYLQFDNRSVVYALLKHAEETPIQCSWKEVKVQEYIRSVGAKDEPVMHGNLILNEHVSDHTLRVENCPVTISDTSLLNFFSRYDLKFGREAIQRWHGVTSDGKKCPPTTYLVHFADASWARAALREKQASFISKFGSRMVVDEKNPQPLRLVQYPRQML